MSKENYKLYYFNARGAAEGIRLLFAYAGVEFEDIRYEGKTDWPQHKDEMPQKMMPVLEIGGKKYCQSAAIFRYLAREFGLYGADNLEALQIDEICETIVDMMKGFGPLFFEEDKEKKKEGVKKVVNETFPKFVPFIVNKLKDNESGFLVGGKMTVVDIMVYRTLDFLKDFFKMCEVDHDHCLNSPELKKHSEMVASNPKIKAWETKRPQTTM